MSLAPPPNGQGTIEFWFWQHGLGIMSDALAKQGATACRRVLRAGLGAEWQTADLRQIDLEQVLGLFTAQESARLKAGTVEQYCQHTRRAVSALLAVHNITKPRPGEASSRTYSLPLPSGAVTSLRLPRPVDGRDVEFLRRVVNLYADTLIDNPVEVLCLQDPDDPQVVSQIAVISAGRLVLAPRVTIVDSVATAPWRTPAERGTFLDAALAGASPAAAAVLADWLAPQSTDEHEGTQA